MKKHISRSFHERIDFEQATLEVLGTEESKIHSNNSRITFGERIVITRGEKYKQRPYLITLAELKLAEVPRFSLVGTIIPPFSEVKRTLRGGLKLRRIENRLPDAISNQSTLSPEEFERLKTYF